MLFSAFALAVVAMATDIATAPVSQPAASRTVAADTPVTIEIAEAVSTRTNKPGDWFAVRLAEPILSDGAVIVPAGALGRGQIVDAGRAGFGGKPAKLVLAARYIEWNGRRTPLRAFRWAQTGADRQTAAGLLLAVPYAGIASIFIHGGEIDVPAGVRAQAKLAEPIPAALPLPVATDIPAPPPAPPSESSR